MIQYIVRFAKRFGILVPGLIVAFVSVHDIYPTIDQRVPAGVAFLLTYILAAYVLIPFGGRLGRLFIKPPHHLPIYSVTPDGFASDPINIGIIGTRDQVIKAMEHAGWDKADEHSLVNIYKEAVSSLLGRTYKTAPMSSLYLFGRKQDLGFEIQIEARMWHRHHVRFWATTYNEDGDFTGDDIHWFRRKELRAHQDDKLLWLGAASKDVGLALIKHNAQLTHMIHPDTNHERDLIADQLQIDGGKLEATVTVNEPYRLTNRAWSGYLQTDGKLKIVRL
jgi:hypothetical protein